MKRKKSSLFLLFLSLCLLLMGTCYAFASPIDHSFEDSKSSNTLECTHHFHGSPIELCDVDHTHYPVGISEDSEHLCDGEIYRAKAVCNFVGESQKNCVDGVGCIVSTKKWIVVYTDKCTKCSYTISYSGPEESSTFHSICN